jgi:hypothetical protein
MIKHTRVAAFLAFAVVFFSFSLPASGQQVGPTRQSRRYNANREARIKRTIAQTYGHRWEVGGGGGGLRFRTGPYLRQSTEITFWGSATYNLNPRLGVLAEVRGAYGSAKIGNLLPSGNSLAYNPKVSNYNFLIGPSYRFVSKEKFAVAGFVEGGAGLGKFAGDSKGLSAANIGVWTGDYAAAFSVGLNLDYNLYENLALRVTPNYLGTTYGGTLQNSKGINVGVVYRFGHQ